MSFINNTNNIGPNIDPCGTPLVTGIHCDIDSSTFTVCFLLDKNDPIHIKTIPFIPYDSIFSGNLICGTASNAYDLTLSCQTFQ